MVTCSSILAWKIPWTDETCGLESMGSQSDLTEPLNNNKAGKNLSFQELLLINSLLAPLETNSRLFSMTLKASQHFAQLIFPYPFLPSFTNLCY